MTPRAVNARVAGWGGGASVGVTWIWIEANVICRGAFGRGGGAYILEEQNGVWTAMGRAPGTPHRVS